MKRKKNHYTAGKGILGILIVTMLIPFFLICIITTTLSLSTNKKLLADNLSGSCAIQVSAIEAFLRSYADSMKILGLTPGVQTLFRSENQISNEEKNVLINVMEKQMSVKTSAQIIIMMNAEGKLLLSTDDMTAARALSSLKLPQEACVDSYFLQYLENMEPGEGQILLCCPIFTEGTQQLCGYMACILGTDYFNRLLQSVALPDFGVILIRDEAGHTISSLYNESDSSIDLSEFHEALDSAWSESNIQQSLQVTAAEASERELSVLSNNYIPQAQTRMASFSFTLGNGLRKEEFMAFHSNVGPTQWQYLISARTSALYEVIGQLTLLMVFVTALGGLTWFVLSVYAAKRIAEPMKRMVDQLSIEVQRNHILNALSGTLIAEYDCETDILNISPEYAEEHNLTSRVDQWKGRLQKKLPHGGAPIPLLDLKAIADAEDAGFVDCPVSFPDGHTERYRLTFAKIRNERNRVVRVLCRACSIEQECNELEKLHEEASIDGLTGILNRLAGERYVKARLLTMAETSTAAFILIDLDHFKPINDTYGHQTGDQVLRSVAQWLRNFYRDQDLVFRLGGDEFVVLLGNMNYHTLVSRVREMEQYEFSDPENAMVHVSFSMGIVFFDKAHADYDTLYQIADDALYCAKKEHTTQIVNITESPVI